MKVTQILLATVIFSVFTAASIANAADAKENYDKKCAKCHGADGDGKGRAGRSLKKEPTVFNKKETLDKVTDDEMFKAIKEGGEAVKQSKEMEAYKDYSDEEIKALVAYIRTLAK